MSSEVSKDSIFPVCSLPLAYESRCELSAILAAIHLLCHHGLPPSETIRPDSSLYFISFHGHGVLLQQQKSIHDWLCQCGS